MNELYSASSILNTVILLAGILGAFIALKNGKRQQTGTIQGQAIDALQAELDVMKGRLGALEKENTKLEQTFALVKQALTQRGMIITIDGNLVTITDTRTGSIQAGNLP